MSKTSARLAKALREQLTAARASDPALLHHQIGARSSRGKVVVSWVAGPLQGTVEQLIAPTCAQVDPAGQVEIVYARETIWSCGQFHADAGEAFLAHEGAHLKTTVTVPGCCEHCSDVEEVVDADELASYIAADGSFETACRPGPSLTICLACGGRGSNTASDLRLVDCGDCATRGTFDLADDDQAAAALEQAAAFLAAYAQRQAAESQRRVRRLP